MHGIELDELLGGHGFSAGHAGNVRHGAVHFLDAMLSEPILQGLGRCAHGVEAGVLVRCSLVGSRVSPG